MKIPKSISKSWLHRKVWPNDSQSGQKFAARTRPEGHKARVKWSGDEIEKAQAAMKAGIVEIYAALFYEECSEAWNPMRFLKVHENDLDNALQSVANTLAEAQAEGEPIVDIYTMSEADWGRLEELVLQEVPQWELQPGDLD